MDPIDAALEYMANLEPGEKVVYTHIAKRFGVNRQSLARRHQGLSTSRAVRYQNQQSLHPQQELYLIQYIDRLCVRGTAPSRSLVRQLASDIAQKDIGYHWVDRFVQRYPDLLKPKTVAAMDRNRHRADSEMKYKLYFQLLRDKFAQYNIDARHIYNMDEKGFAIGVQSRSKRIFSTASLQSGARREPIQDGNREWVTLIACICADGSHLAPSIIYQSQSGSLQHSWLQGFDPETDHAHFISSPSGWSNHQIGRQWLEQVFDRETKVTARTSWRVLFMDGHKSHLTMEFLDYCEQNKILLAIFPPHATHTLQPLDVALFKPLATAYSNELASFIQSCQGLLPITKSHFFPLFQRAWEASFKESSILRAFEATGLSPFNPEVILQKFETMAHHSDSDSSALSAPDWRKIRELIDRAINQKESRTIAQLNRKIMKLSAHSNLIQRENEKLREALIDERQRKQRSQPGTIEQPDDYHGGAGFWSPRKIREARQLHEQKQRDQEQLQHQKSIAKKARQEAKLLKERERDARRRARAEARLLREKQRADEAAERAARQAARKAAKRLQKVLKTSQKGKKKNLKARAKPLRKKIIASDHSGGRQLPERPTSPPSVRTRGGRDIKLPAKYR